ncbi:MULTISPECIES: response regulator transcription factor [Cytobacillus]|uniref:response regulator transcription factor n=1 Tax=Cytobacillus TaxID=2675230 RepID=UPI00203F176F|nr:response regulator transcription factor [Cytobacillus firmus]MCM3704836.1 response regulator transcription factor [Cytobacillus firmus]
MTRILIVEDDREIAELMQIYLENEGYDIIKATDGIEGFETLKAEPVDLIILDIMMPRMDGLEFCKKARQHSYVPILMVSAKAGDIDKIMGLMTGADDYMIKPFNPLELTARVKALLRRASYQPATKEQDIIHAGSYIIDKHSHTVTVDDIPIKLTVREFNILFLLASHRGRVFTSEEIFEKVWKEPSGGSNQTVMVHISNLREKLEAAMPGEKIIQTVWGVGYKIEK